MVPRWLLLAIDTGVLREDAMTVLWLVLGMAGLILMAGLIIIWLGRWLKHPPADTTQSSGDQLTYFRLLYEQGECSREEYERIRAKLGQRLRKELDLPAQPAPTESSARTEAPAQTEEPLGPSANGPAT